ncbi:hypothetical protein [Mesorhizobium sp. CO1-1-8]|uniref:hypothetical protein n=1 Tax=Mesorhizobium sp. CO1-1-8 TaxID=2876631 RepID=UPI001CD0957C|nr:hypothetical protein [Mesorhizobium sp. CO1-1-8]MBZ9775037.1 hypothetical protein [Mesorhizobium sp. CO1-1-8]
MRSPPVRATPKWELKKRADRESLAAMVIGTNSREKTPKKQGGSRMRVFSGRNALAKALFAGMLSFHAGLARAEGGPAPQVNDNVSVASFCLGEDAFVTAGIFGGLFKWSLETGKVVSTYTFPKEPSIFTARCLSHGTRIAIGLDSFMVAVWDGTSGKINDILTGKSPEADPDDGGMSPFVKAVSVSDDAKLIAAGHGKA